MRACDVSNPIQCFTPNPAKTTTLTLTAGTATWTPTAGTKVYAVYPSTPVVQKLNSATTAGTTGLTLDASSISGPFGLHANTASITFTGTAGQTVVIEAD